MAANLFADVERSGMFEREVQDGNGQRHDDGSGSGEWSAAEILERVDWSRGKLVLDLKLAEDGVTHELVMGANPMRSTFLFFRALSTA